MSRTQAQVRSDLFAVQPDGWALPDDMDSVWGPMLSPLAAEGALFEAQADEMLAETDPRQAMALLPQFEQLLGPDPCGRDQMTLTFQQRTALAYQRYTARGGASIGFFTQLAAAMGVAITITEVLNTVAGRMQAGQAVAPSPNQMAWIVNLPSTIVTRFVAGASRAGESLGSFAPSLVACAIARLAPAHTQPVFDYSGPTTGPQWDAGAQWDEGAQWA